MKWLAKAHHQLGRIDLALEALAKVRPQGTPRLAFRGDLLAEQGHGNEAREVLSTLEAVGRDRYVSPYQLALVHAGLGERDAVFEWLDKAVAARDIHLIFLPVDPKWDPYRADGRFETVLARCGFTRKE